MISRREFEDLLKANKYPKRLIKKLSAAFPQDLAETEQTEESEEDADAILTSLREFTDKFKV